MWIYGPLGKGLPVQDPAYISLRECTIQQANHSRKQGLPAQLPKSSHQSLSSQRNDRSHSYGSTTTNGQRLLPTGICRKFIQPAKKLLKPRHPKDHYNNNVRNVTTYYYTKNYKNQATDRRQDQEPITNTTNETTNSGEHPSNPLSKPPNLQLQPTEDKKHPNPTTTMDNKKKTSTRKKDVAIQVLTAILQLNKKDKIIYVSLQFRQYKNHGLLDTGAIRSAMSEDELRRLLSAHPAALLEEYPAPDFKVQIANGSIVPVRKQVLLRFFIGGKVFEETFMILSTMGNILIGMSFFKKYSVTPDLANNVVKFLDITLQLKPERGRYKIQMIKLRTTRKTVIQPDHQLIVPVLAERDRPRHNSGYSRNLSCIQRKTQLLVSPALTQIADMKSHVQITNLTSHTITLNPNTTVATFRIMTPNQAKNLQPMSNEQLTLITKYPDEANNVLDQLSQEPNTDTNRRWYPTPETCDDPSKLNRIEKRVYDEITKLREEEKLDPTADDQQRKEFLANFKWKNSILDERER